MKKNHFNQLLVGLSLIGLLFTTACGEGATQENAAVKAEVEQLESAAENMTKIKEDVESSKAEVEAAMEDLDAILEDKN